MSLANTTRSKIRLKDNIKPDSVRHQASDAVIGRPQVVKQPGSSKAGSTLTLKPGSTSKVWMSGVCAAVVSSSSKPHQSLTPGPVNPSDEDSEREGRYLPSQAAFCTVCTYVYIIFLVDTGRFVFYLKLFIILLHKQLIILFLL
jgi:hypothetical protein